MSDDELDRTVKNCIGENQRIGPNAVKARLFSQDINVQRWWVRDSMMRVDEGGIALRANIIYNHMKICSFPSFPLMGRY